MNDKEQLLELINNLKEDKGGNLKDYMEFISFIGHLESKNNPNAVQKGAEIGKGAFQFEDISGSNRILTAANRTKNYYKDKGMLDSMPSFVNNILEKGTEDARNLSYNQQSLLLLGDARMGAADLSEFIGKGKDSLSDYWATYHWAGHKGLETLKQDKINSFSKHIDNFYNDKDTILGKVSNNTGITDLYEDRTKEDIIQDNTQKVNKLKNVLNNGKEVNLKQPQLKSQDNLQLTDYIKEQNQRQPIFLDEQQKTNSNKLGGIINSLDLGNKNLNEFNTGGLHSQNRLGGIPQGVGSNGKQNTVEEGETSFDTKQGKFIFSDKIGSISNIINQYKAGGLVKSNCGGPNQPDCPEEKKVVGPTKEDMPLETTKQLRTDINGWVPGTPINTEKTQIIPQYDKEYKNLIEKNPKVDYKTTNKSQKNFKDWFTDPETINRMKEQTNLSEDQLGNMIRHGLAAKKSNKKIKTGTQGEYYPDEHEVVYNDDDTGFHETIHASNLDAVLGEGLMDVLGSPFKQEKKTGWSKIKRYMSQPHEAYSNFSQFRKELGLKPGEKIDNKKLKDLLQKNRKATESNFYNTFDDDKIIKAINTIANNPKKSNKNTKLT